MTGAPRAQVATDVCASVPLVIIGEMSQHLYIYMLGGVRVPWSFPGPVPHSSLRGPRSWLWLCLFLPLSLVQVAREAWLRQELWGSWEQVNPHPCGSIEFPETPEGVVRMAGRVRGQLEHSSDDSKWQETSGSSAKCPGHQRMQPLILPGLKVEAGDQGRLLGGGGFEALRSK